MPAFDTDPVAVGELKSWLAAKNLQIYLPGILQAGITSLGALAAMPESGIEGLATAVGMSAAHASTLKRALRRLRGS